MADNVAITAGTGTTVAADEVTDGTLGSCKVQFVKLMDGTLDGTSKAAVGANGLAADVKASVLPTGAATAAKQPALGTAGVSSTDVISVQGIASGTALPISGSVTVSSAPSTAVTNAGTFAVQATLAAGAAAIAKAEDVASADADVGVPAMVIRKATPANTSGTDGDYEMLQASAGRLWVDIGGATTIKSSVTRPADTNVYAVNDAMSDSTSAPTSGGFTVTSAARFSGGSGIITDVIVSSSADPATTLQGEIWVLDQAGTNVNDNAAFAMADADVLNVIAVIPFTLASTQAGSGTNSFAHVQGLNIGFTCVGTANLRYLLKVKNAYTPISAEVIQIAWKILQTT